MSWIMENNSLAGCEPSGRFLPSNIKNNKIRKGEKNEKNFM